MGVFNKINQRSGVVSLIVLGSLILFLVGADFFSSFSFLSGNSTIGKIDGSSISREEYAKAIDKANALSCLLDIANYFMERSYNKRHCSAYRERERPKPLHSGV